MAKGFDFEKQQQAAIDYLATRDAMRTRMDALGEAFTTAAATIHGSGSPQDTGLKLKTAGHRMVELGDAFIDWHNAFIENERQQPKAGDL